MRLLLLLLNGCQLEWVLILGREEQLTPKELMSYIAGGSVQDGSPPSRDCRPAC